MPHTGRPRLLDEARQREICALVSAGVNVREAARSVGCDRTTIHNEARRNDEFRRRLGHAKSRAQVHPLRTMHEAAATNWRAAAWWLERLAPDTFAAPAGSGGSVLGQREANKFAGDLIEIIERAVTSPIDQVNLFELLTAALPAAMRRSWDHRLSSRRLKQAMDYFDRRRAEDTRGLHANPLPADVERDDIKRFLSEVNDRVQQLAAESLVRSPSRREKQQACLAAKTPQREASPAASTPSRPETTNSSPADSSSSPPVNNAANSSTHDSRKHRDLQHLPRRCEVKHGEFFHTEKIKKRGGNNPAARKQQQSSRPLARGES